MNLLKTTTWTWWQIGLLKWSVLLVGISLGAYWSDFFLPYAGLCLVAGLALGMYIAYLWLKQM